MIKVIALTFLLITSSVKAGTDKLPPIEQQLIQFAKANCLYQYFQHKGYELDDIRNISAGFVQVSTLAPEVFVGVSMLVKNYESTVRYKNETSPLLAKCFTLENDPAFLERLRKFIQSE